MKTGLYARLAFGNLGKNRRIFLPQILTGAGLTAVLYILLTLSGDERLRSVRGGNYLPEIMRIGAAVIAVLSVILLFYTNGFLMKQRGKEFGLYRVLGMEKRHLGRILFYETLYSAAASVLFGLLFGVILYKLCALIICRLLQVESVLGFYYVRPFPLLFAGIFFTAVYLLIFLSDRIRIARMNTAALLQSTRVGEREPKARLPLAILGLLSVGAGYYLAIATENPLKVLNIFLPAVMLVILGTYLLFLSGSITLFKALRKNRRFYYRKDHMVSLSGLIYRMKRNAVGMASIAILSVGVLVMVSVTICLYAGIADTLEKRFPHPVYYSFSYNTKDGEFRAVPVDVQLKAGEQAAREQDLELDYIQEHRYASVTALYEDGNIVFRAPEDTDYKVLKKLCTVFFMTAQEYEKLTGTDLHLKEGECAVYNLPGNTNTLKGPFRVNDIPFSVKEDLTGYPQPVYGFYMADVFGVVVNDEDTFREIDRVQEKIYGQYASMIRSEIVVDFTDRGKAEEKINYFWISLHDRIGKYIDAQPDAEDGWGSSSDSVWEAGAEMYGLNGTLLFLGMLLSLVFLFATVLIIYYKQISEGYEDRERFRILQQVGMSGKEVGQTIRAQIRMMFFLPLVTAGVHMMAAFPMLYKLLKILFSGNAYTFLFCCIGVYAVFAAVYVLIFSLTERVQRKQMECLYQL